MTTGPEVGAGGCLPGDKGPVTGRYICRDRGETAVTGAKRLAVTLLRARNGRALHEKGASRGEKGQFSRKGANLRVLN